jgi:glycosyltransferase involved in cell wall biosynthesis
MQVMAGAENGGAELFFERLVVALGRAGADAPEQFLVLRKGARASRMRAQGFPLEVLPFGGPFDFLTSYRVKRRISRYEPHIVLAWMSRAAKALPSSAQIGSTVLCGRLGGYYNLKYFRHCEYLICNTPDIRRYAINRGWPSAKAHVIPNFVPDPGPLIPRVREDHLRLLALGRLHRNKAFDVLLSALAHVPRVSLTLAGEGPEARALRNHARQCGVEERVDFIGWQNDLPALFAQVDILICPSRHEPLGNVILDAWAHGVPVIAAASEGPRQLISDRQNGLLVPVDDALALAEAIRMLTRSDTLRASLGIAGRSAYETNFSENHAVDAYLGFFEKVLR